MKTLLLSEVFPPKVGGSGRWFWEIYSKLPRDKYVVAAGFDPLAHDFDSTHKLMCFRWPLTLRNWGVSSISSIKAYLNLFSLLRTAVKIHNVVAIHCGTGLPEGLLGWVALKWFGIPYLCYVHGEELQIHNSSREYKLLSQLVYSNAQQIIVNSLNTQRMFSLHTGIVDNVRLMYPGVDSKYFVPKQKDEDKLSQFGWSGKKIILTVGRLQKRKGQDHMILAMKKILEKIPNALYVIVGDGEERCFLENLVTAEKLHDHVRFMGKVDDATMLDCYQQCDLFVLANREFNRDFEGFGMVLIEAQACGKPVIAGNSGGTAETMIVGETGLLVDATNIDSIADEVLQLLTDDERRDRMGNCAVSWVREKFDWSVLVAQADKIFEDFITLR
jgi:phosphatidylinositol alpha-1,6-mannosyltransferase